MEQTTEELKDEIDQLRSEQEHSETALSENLAKINNLEKKKMGMTDNICNLQIKFDEIASEIKKLEFGQICA